MTDPRIVRFQEFLAARGMRMTPERRLAAEAVLSFGETPIQIEDVMSRLSEITDVRVSRAAVARTVALMVKAGLARKPDGPVPRLGKRFLAVASCIRSLAKLNKDNALPIEVPETTFAAINTLMGKKRGHADYPFLTNTDCWRFEDALVRHFAPANALEHLDRIPELRLQQADAVERADFERAAEIRDAVVEIRSVLATIDRVTVAVDDIETVLRQLGYCE